MWFSLTVVGAAFEALSTAVRIEAAGGEAGRGHEGARRAPDVVELERGFHISVSGKKVFGFLVTQKRYLHRVDSQVSNTLNITTGLVETDSSVRLPIFSDTSTEGLNSPNKHASI